MRVLPNQVLRRLERQASRGPIQQLAQEYARPGKGLSDVWEPYTGGDTLEGISEGEFRARGDQLELSLRGQTELAETVSISLLHGPAGVALKKVTDQGNKTSTLEQTFNSKGEQQGIALHSVSEDPDGHKRGHITMVSYENKGQGKSRELLCDLVEDWDRQGVEEVDLSAVLVGSYTWLKYGFTPSEESWQKLGDKVQDRASELDLGWRTRRRVKKLARQSDPQTAWQIADMSQLVEYEGRQVKLGQALTLDQGWSGTLDLKDEASRQRLKNYLAR